MKTHYRRVFKSDHLGIADLEDFIEENKTLVHTIKVVKQEMGVRVAGIKGDHNIAYFVDLDIKPLVLNVTNSKVLKLMCGGSPFVEDWKNLVIELYIRADVRMKGEVVGGVRIRPSKKQLTKDETIKKIDAAESLFDLTAIKPEITKHGLEDRAKLKYEEITND